MKKVLVIIPTCNEREMLPVVIDAVLKHTGFDVLVVDDASEDGTAGVVRGMMTDGGRVFLLERTGKFGLGTAYVEGFKWGLEKDYGYFIEMDADGSHDPAMLNSFIVEMEKGRGLVIGSRYLNGTISVLGWDFRRLIISKFGNFYASSILRTDLSDLTSGYRCYSRWAIESIDLDKVHSNGYAFQIEMAYRVLVSGFSVSEISIIFSERITGYSKMSKKIVREAILIPWRLRIEQMLNGVRDTKFGDVGYHIRTIAGVLSVISGVAGCLLLGWWLSTSGDIIEIIHETKMGLPGWAWGAMKVGLSGVSGLLFLAFFVVLAILVFSVGGRK
jgi:dolichol-phosphate mannosyltransferase